MARPRAQSRLGCASARHDLSARQRRRRGHAGVRARPAGRRLRRRPEFFAQRGRASWPAARLTGRSFASRTPRAKPPPALGERPGVLSIMAWSLRLRWYAARVAWDDPLPTPDVQVFAPLRPARRRDRRGARLRRPEQGSRRRGALVREAARRRAATRSSSRTSCCTRSAPRTSTIARHGSAARAGWSRRARPAIRPIRRRTPKSWPAASRWRRRSGRTGVAATQIVVGARDRPRNRVDPVTRRPPRTMRRRSPSTVPGRTLVRELTFELARGAHAGRARSQRRRQELDAARTRGAARRRAPGTVRIAGRPLARLAAPGARANARPAAAAGRRPVSRRRRSRPRWSVVTRTSISGPGKSADGSRLRPTCTGGGRPGGIRRPRHRDAVGRRTPAPVDRDDPRAGSGGLPARRADPPARPAAPARRAAHVPRPGRRRTHGRREPARRRARGAIRRPARCCCTAMAAGSTASARRRSTSARSASCTAMQRARTALGRRAHVRRGVARATEEPICRTAVSRGCPGPERGSPGRREPVPEALGSASMPRTARRIGSGPGIRAAACRRVQVSTRPQCVTTVFENRFSTTTPATISASPTIAARSSAWP